MPSIRTFHGPSEEETLEMQKNTQKGSYLKGVYYGGFSLPGRGYYKLIEKMPNPPASLDTFALPLLAVAALIFFAWN